MKVKNATSSHVPGQLVSIDCAQPNWPGGVAMQRLGARIGAVNAMAKKPLINPIFQNFDARSAALKFPPNHSRGGIPE
jgi:hypothetical protein